MKVFVKQVSLHIFLSHLGSMIKVDKFKLPSMTISARVLHEVKEENQFFPREPTHPIWRVVKGFGLEALCKASVSRLKE